MHGIPIHVGDLIRVQHYRHRRRRRMMWLYFRVAKLSDKLVVQNWNNLDPTRSQCSLEDCGISRSEVLAAGGLEHDADGYLITFNERKRKAVSDDGA